MRLLFVYAGIAVTVAVVIGSLNMPTYYRLAQHGTRADGVVVHTTCNNHQTFSFRFTVDGRTIEGHGGSGYGNPDCGRLKPGDRVIVSYLPAEPAVNSPGDARARLKNETISVGLAALVMPALLVGIYRYSMRKRRRVKLHHDPATWR